MQYIRSLPRVEGRALSCAWHPTARDVLVVGSGDGCVRAWNVAQGNELVRITAGMCCCGDAMVCCVVLVCCSGDAMACCVVFLFT